METSGIETTELSPEVIGWLSILSGLVEDVRAWAGAGGWETRLTSMHMNEKEGARYEVPVLVMDRDEAEVSVVPVARKTPRADGVVDFYRMPDFDDVASLYRQEGRWFLHYAFHPGPTAADSGVEPQRFALDQDSLNRVLDDIAAHP